MQSDRTVIIMHTVVTMFKYNYLLMQRVQLCTSYGWHSTSWTQLQFRQMCDTDYSSCCMEYVVQAALHDWRTCNKSDANYVYNVARIGVHAASLVLYKCYIIVFCE